MAIHFYKRSRIRRLARVALVVASLFGLVNQSVIAIGCELHDAEHAMGSAHDLQLPAQDDGCHACCGSMSAGHCCAHGISLPSTVIQTVFTPQAILAPPSFFRCGSAQHIPPGMFRPPIAA